MTLSSRKMRSQRVLEINVTADVSANTFLVNSVKQRRDGLDGDTTDVAFESNLSNPSHIELGEALSGHTVITITGTIQA